MVVNFFANEVTILLGDGTGNFTEAPGSPVSVGDSSNDVAVGDFDGDGHLDLAVASFDGVTILINQSPDGDPPRASEEPAAVVRVAAGRQARALRPAVFRPGDSALRAAATADRGAGDAGAKAVSLARTGLPLPLLALAGSLLLGAGSRMRRRVGDWR